MPVDCARRCEDDSDGDDFDAMYSLVKPLSQETQQLSSGLTVNKLIPIEFPLPVSAPSFHGKTRLTTITLDGNCQRVDKLLPRLICPPNELAARLITRDLALNFSGNVLISNYIDYRDTKWQVFMEALKEHHFQSGQLPIICFSGVITRLIGTAYGHSKWSINAYRIEDKIYLQTVRPEQRKNFKQRSDNPKRRVNDVCFENYLLKFVQYVTVEGADRKNANEFEKSFEMFKTNFGQHSLILFNEVDALFGDDYYKIGLYCPENQKNIKDKRRIKTFFTKKVIDMWAQMVTNSIQGAIIGTRTSDGKVTNVEASYNLPTLAANNGEPFEPLLGLTFLSKFLSHVHSELTENNPNRVINYNFGNSYPCEITVKILPENDALQVSQVTKKARVHG
ncbi:Decapping and exoribonuclease protein [Halotydeus destructor]|nr:Decapping and exoribonuclease protein [Halotydeus destructor]